MWNEATVVCLFPGQPMATAGGGEGGFPWCWAWATESVGAAGRIWLFPPWTVWKNTSREI